MLRTPFAVEVIQRCNIFRCRAIPYFHEQMALCSRVRDCAWKCRKAVRKLTGSVAAGLMTGNFKILFACYIFVWNKYESYLDPLARSYSSSALRPAFKPPPRDLRRSEFRVIISGLPPSASWQDLKDYFRSVMSRYARVCVCIFVCK